VHVVPQSSQKGVEETVQFEAVAAPPPLNDFLVEVGHRQYDALSRPLAVGIARDGERLERDSGEMRPLEPTEGLQSRPIDRPRSHVEALQVDLDLLCSKCRSRRCIG